MIEGDFSVSASTLDNQAVSRGLGLPMAEYLAPLLDESSIPNVGGHEDRQRYRTWLDEVVDMICVSKLVAVATMRSKSRI